MSGERPESSLRKASPVKTIRLFLFGGVTGSLRAFKCFVFEARSCHGAMMRNRRGVIVKQPFSRHFIFLAFEYRGGISRRPGPRSRHRAALHDAAPALFTELLRPELGVSGNRGRSVRETECALFRPKNGERLVNPPSIQRGRKERSWRALSNSATADRSVRMSKRLPVASL